VFSIKNLAYFSFLFPFTEKRVYKNALAQFAHSSFEAYAGRSGVYGQHRLTQADIARP
jgi:hypothetical protein